jgi:hypothetical protein
MFGKKGGVPRVPVNGLSMSVEVDPEAVSEVDDRAIGRELEFQRKSYEVDLTKHT